jgi:hypothetical protein
MEKCVGQLRIRYVVNRAVGRVLSRCYKGVVEAEVGIGRLKRRYAHENASFCW